MKVAKRPIRSKSNNASNIQAQIGIEKPSQQKLLFVFFGGILGWTYCLAIGSYLTGLSRVTGSGEGLGSYITGLSSKTDSGDGLGLILIISVLGLNGGSTSYNSLAATL
jgi:hypothetical protein